MNTDPRPATGSDDTARGYPALVAYTGLDESELRAAITDGELAADLDCPEIGYRTLEQWLRARMVERLLADPEFFDQRVDLAANVHQAS